MNNASLEKVLSQILIEEGNDITVEKLRAKIDVAKRLVEIWYTKKSLKTPEATAAERNHRLVEFGSCALTPKYRATDVDLLLIGSQRVLGMNCESEFEAFIRRCRGVSCVSRCEGSRFTPSLVRFKLDRFGVDLQFARVDEKALDPTFSLNRDWSDVRSVDQNSLMGLQAVAVSRKILEMVPEVEKFRIILRVVKRWALRRAIYKHKFGYPGGIAFTILVAKACQELDPSGKKPTRRLLEQFFEYYAEKTWGQDNPVFLGKYYPDYPNQSLCYEYMQVFTPQRDPWNCTHNVNESTLPVVKREFQRADFIVKQSKTKSLHGVVYHLCDGDDFFLEFPVYLRFDCVTWRGDEYFEGFTVKALRTFCKSLQIRLREEWNATANQTNTSLVYARLYPFSFKGKQHILSSEQETHSYWIGAHLNGPEMVILELLQHFAAVMLKTKERQQYQFICPFLSKDLPNDIFPKPWRGLFPMRPKDWKPTEVPSNPPGDQSSMPAPVRRRSPSPRPPPYVNIPPRINNSFGRMSLHDSRQSSAPLKRATHNKPVCQKASEIHHHQQPHQQPSQNPYLSITNPQRQRQRRSKRRTQSNQLTSRRNQLNSSTHFQNGNSFQSNGKRQLIQTHRGNGRKISQQSAESPLPVVINAAHVSPPKYVHPNSLQSRPTTVVNSSLAPDTNTYPITSCHNAKNHNYQYNNNLNLNRTSPRPGQKEKVVNANPHQNLQGSKLTHTVSTEGLNREVDSGKLTVQTNSDLVYPNKVVPNRAAMLSNLNRNFVQNSRTKASIGKTIQWVPEEKLIPCRRRNTPAVVSPPGMSKSTPNDETFGYPRRNSTARARFF